MMCFFVGGVVFRWNNLRFWTSMSMLSTPCPLTVESFCRYLHLNIMYHGVLFLMYNKFTIIQRNQQIITFITPKIPRPFFCVGFGSKDLQTNVVWNWRFKSSQGFELRLQRNPKKHTETEVSWITCQVFHIQLLLNLRLNCCGCGWINGCFWFP